MYPTLPAGKCYNNKIKHLIMFAGHLPLLHNTLGEILSNSTNVGMILNN